MLEDLDGPAWPVWSDGALERPSVPPLGVPGPSILAGPTFLQPPLAQPLQWSGYVAVRDGLLNQWEQIYQDESVKDVEVVLKDGVAVMADSIVLKVSSPVFRAMLSHDMQEKREMKFVIDDYTSGEFRFFLRLLYTGRMDPSDWPVDEQVEEPHSTGSTGSPVSQPPATAHPVLPFECRQSECHGSGFARGYNQVGWRGFVPGQAQCWNHGRQVSRVPPVDLLLAAAALSKRYQVDWLLHVLVDVVKRRLTEASFEGIIRAAMLHDIAPVRLGALEFARRSQEVRWRYDSGEYPSEIMFELQAAFPVPMNSCELNTISI